MDRRQSFSSIVGIAAAAAVAGSRVAPTEAATEFAATTSGASQPKRVSGSVPVTPAEQLDAFLKIFVSRRPATIWYWYTGTLDAAMPGRPIVPLLACDTLIRREVLPQPGGLFAIRTFEANYFHLPADARPLQVFTNPLNGRDVTPLHYREGPHFLVLSEQAPRFVAGADPARVRIPAVEGAAIAPMALGWRRIGSLLLASRESYSDRPNPLDPAVWPLESSGTRLSTGSFANYFADAEQVAMPSTDNVSCDFAYQAIFAWWPWLLMGQTPGQLVWRAHGRKLDSLADVPSASRAAFEQLHPRLFAAGLPWTEHASMWEDFLRTRRPTPI